MHIDFKLTTPTCTGTLAPQEGLHEQDQREAWVK